MNLTSIVYIGEKESVLLKFHGRNYKLIARQPRQVPDEFAERLLRQQNYIRADDLDKTIEDRCMGGSVVVRRWGAMGDLIMLRAVLSAFVRESPGFSFKLRCQERWWHLFEHDPLFAGARPEATGETVISMDQIAEADHRGVQKHRIDLFMEALTNRKLDIRREDWQLPIPEATKKYVHNWLISRRLTRGQRQRPLIGLQVHGSSGIKSLPDEQIRKLSRILSDYAEVVLIEHEERRVWVGEHIHAMTGRDALHSIQLLSMCDLCVCFDSGVLWLAHCAACPVLCIMGPTRAEQRLTYHPLYAEGKARDVRLNEIVTLNGKQGCDPCFESQGACKQTAACMQRQPDSALDVIRDAALAMVGVRVALPVLSAS